MKKDGIAIGALLESGEKVYSDRVILATGGKSYPLTGSTGDGYKMAKEVGHTVVDARGSLVPIKADTDICQRLQGLSLRNVKIAFIDKDKSKEIYDDFGEMLFTHFGVSGPTILSGSAHLLRYKDVDSKIKERSIVLKIDLKPALSEEELDKRVLRDFEEFKNKEFKNSLEKLLPKKMIDVVIDLSGIDRYKKVNEITKEERLSLVKLLKDFEITIDGFRPVEEAIVTAGGVSIKEINPKTMESKIVSGLFFAGEIIDVDAYTGGFNLQIAYSTGYTAGKNN
jgi:predicted Rossmann fold flavoprotein